MRSTHFISADQTEKSMQPCLTVQASTSLCLQRHVQTCVLKIGFESFNPKCYSLWFVSWLQPAKFFYAFCSVLAISKTHHTPVLSLVWLWKITSCSAWVFPFSLQQVEDQTRGHNLYNVHLYRQWLIWKRQTWKWPNLFCCFTSLQLHWTYNNLQLSSKCISRLGFFGWWSNLGQNVVPSSFCLNFQNL